MRKAGADMDDLFQSTLSMRRATTGNADDAVKAFEFQSTLSMRRATLQSLWTGIMAVVFQSTLSMRRATRQHGHASRDQHLISIHALHEESD